MKTRQSKWVESNRDKYNAYQREYRRKHRDKVNEWKRANYKQKTD